MRGAKAAKLEPLSFVNRTLISLTRHSVSALRRRKRLPHSTGAALQSQRLKSEEIRGGREKVQGAQNFFQIAANLLQRAIG